MILAFLILLMDQTIGELPCDGIRIEMKNQTMSIPLDTCIISVMNTKNEVEAYKYSCDKDKNFFWNIFSTNDCTGDKQSFPLSVLIQQMNGTLLETKCDNTPCPSKIIQFLYEINQCGEEIDENTKYSQSAMITNQCITGPQYSVKHKCFKGNSKKVKSIYYSDTKCKKKIKEYVSNCDIKNVSYNKDTCTESGAENQLGVISDTCCIKSHI
eukprot:204381_1